MFFLFSFVSWLISFLVHGIVFVLLLGALGYCAYCRRISLADMKGISSPIPRSPSATRRPTSV